MGARAQRRCGLLGEGKRKLWPATSSSITSRSSPAAPAATISPMVTACGACGKSETPHLTCLFCELDGVERYGGICDEHIVQNGDRIGDRPHLRQLPRRRLRRGPRQRRLGHHEGWSPAPGVARRRVRAAPLLGWAAASRYDQLRAAAPWCSGLTRHPVKVEIVGSNPIGVASQLAYRGPLPFGRGLGAPSCPNLYGSFGFSLTRQLRQVDHLGCRGAMADSRPTHTAAPICMVHLNCRKLAKLRA